MENYEILKSVDHTELSPLAGVADIIRACREAAEYKTASVCVPPAYVREAAVCLCGEIPVCTVVGFPNGYSATAVKLFETETALNRGASEIDMVINIGMLKSKNYEYVLSEISKIKNLAGEKILKVIIETCLLDSEEKIKMCEIIREAKADFLKTSTGFSASGAELGDMALFKSALGDVKIKASGGISTFADANAFIRAGANRIGSSKLIKLYKEGVAGGL